MKFQTPKMLCQVLAKEIIVYKKVILIAVSILQMACTAKQVTFVPTPKMERFEIVKVVTPSRILVNRNFTRYAVDLAYFRPNQNLCSEVHDKTCDLLSIYLGEDVWIERNYDRYGLEMHTAWLDDPQSDDEKAYPLNLIMIIKGDLEILENVDNHNLPDNLAYMISMAQDANLNRHMLENSKQKMKPWQLNKFKKGAH